MQTLEFSGCTWDDESAAIVAKALRASTIEKLAIAGSRELIDELANGISPHLIELALRSDGDMDGLDVDVLAAILARRPCSLRTLWLQGLELQADSPQALVRLGNALAAHPTLEAVRMDGSVAICGAQAFQDFVDAVLRGRTITDFAPPRRCAMPAALLVRWMLASDPA